MKKRIWEYRWVDACECHLHHSANWRKAYEYAKLMESGVQFPAVKVAMDKNGKYLVRDGAHRTTAARLCGKKLLIKLYLKKRREDGTI